MTPLEQLTNNPNFKKSPSDRTLALIRSVRGAIVEVGGTTKDLIDPLLLPHSPITTDIRAGDGVDVMADGKALPFQNNSISMIMADHIAAPDLVGHQEFINPYTDTPNPNEGYIQVSEQAVEDYSRFFDDPNCKIEYNLIINMMREMNRVVEPSGLIAFGHLNDLDLKVAKELGWSIVDILTEEHLGNKTHYDVVFQKTKG